MGRKQRVTNISSNNIKSKKVNKKSKSDPDGMGWVYHLLTNIILVTGIAILIILVLNLFYLFGLMPNIFIK